MKKFFTLSITLRTIFLMQVLLLLLIGAGVWTMYSTYMMKYHGKYTASFEIVCKKPPVNV